ncbi:MAG: hypothetical protein ACTSXW_00075 [Candidatus Baldrarchaeia archaeon]
MSWKESPSEEDLKNFKQYVENACEDLYTIARNDAEMISSKVKEGNFKVAAEFVLDMVINSVLVNNTESPRKVIEFMRKKTDKYGRIFGSDAFKVAEKLLKAFENKDLDMFSEAMQEIVDKLFGKISLELRFSTLKDLHCAFFTYR